MALSQKQMTYLTTIKSFFRSKPEFFVFPLTTIIVILGLTFLYYANKEDVQTIESSYNSAYEKTRISGKDSLKLDSIPLCKTLSAINSYTSKVKASKLYLASLYQRYFLICYTIGIIFVGLAAVVGFVVTKNGWDNSDRFRKVLFLTFTFYAVLLTKYPSLFDQEQNFRRNFSDYHELSNSQLYTFKILQPYTAKIGNVLNHEDSSKLQGAVDSISNVLMKHSAIDFSMDKKQLEDNEIKER